MVSRQGLAFTAWLGKSEQSDPRTVLIEVQGDELRVSRTGGDAWSCCVLGGSDGAATPAAGAVQTCNKWDAKGRNPALNVYVDIDAYRGSSSPSPRGAPSSSGGGGGGSSSEGEDDEGPSRCKLGHLIQHCLPQLAARLGGYRQLALCWCTWLADEKSGQPVPSSIAAVGVQDPAHWRLLRQLAKEKEAGAGVRSGSPPPPDEEAALRRAKETLLEAAGYFGAEAVAKCASLTVRKLYQREYHFFSPSGEDVADSRRHALEWAAGLAAVNDMLDRCPEVRAKISERLTGPTAGGGSRPRKRRRHKSAPDGGGSRRVVLAVGQSAGPLGTANAAGWSADPGAAMPGVAAADASNALQGLRLPALNLGSHAAPPTELAVPPTLGPAALQLPPIPPPLLAPPAAPEPPASLLLQAQPGAAAAAGVQPPGQPAAEPDAARRSPAASQGFTEWLQMQMAAAPSCSFGLSLLQPLQQGAATAAAEVEQRTAQAAQAAMELQPSSPQPPPPSPSPRCAHCAQPQGAAAPAAQEVVPLDAVLHAWQEHDAVRRELADTQRQLGEVTRERDSLRRQLNAALTQLQSLASMAAPAASTS